MYVWICANRLKAVQNKKFKSVPKPPPPDGESTSQMTSKKGSDEEDEKEEESGNESGGEDQTGANEADGEVRQPMKNQCRGQNGPAWFNVCCIDELTLDFLSYWQLFDLIQYRT